MPSKASTKKTEVVGEQRLAHLYKKLEEFRQGLDTNEQALFAAMLSPVGGSGGMGDSLLSAQDASVVALRRLLAGSVSLSPTLRPASGNADGMWAQWAQRKDGGT